MDEKILKWLLCMREKHLAVSTQMLREKAVALVKPHHSAFKGSEGWLRKFMHRHSLVLRARTEVSRKLPSDLEAKIKDFYTSVRNLRIKHKFPKELVGNMDETPMFFDLIPGCTIDKKEGRKLE